jgi:hypothetical protein
MKLIAVISHDNYYSQFYHPFCELVCNIINKNYVALLAVTFSKLTEGFERYVTGENFLVERTIFPACRNFLA